MIQLRLSASYFWFNCAAQPRFAAQIPEEEPGDPAREGTCAAWVAEKVLTGEKPDALSMLEVSHENGWIVDRDMARHIQGYVNHVRSRGVPVSAERYVRVNEMIAGTPDSWAIVADHTLYVDDLKYGFDPVEPYRNTQVAGYAGAIIRALLKTDVKIRKVVIGIYQPRCVHPQGIYRTWVINPETLMQFVHEIEAAGHDAQDVTKPATPGYHCEYCPAAASCVALTHSVYKGYRRLSDERQMGLNAQQISDELAFAEMMQDMLKGRSSALKAEALARKSQGEHIPGWMLEERYGNTKMTMGHEVITALTGIDATEVKIATPAELIRRGVDPDFVKRNSARPRIPPKLKRISDDYYRNLFPEKK